MLTAQLAALGSRLSHWPRAVRLAVATDLGSDIQHAKANVEADAEADADAN
jgi:hypothetical protein